MDQSASSDSNLEARPPSFPRPSSSLSKIRLVERTSFGNHKKDSKSPWRLNNEGGDHAMLASSLWPSAEESIYSSHSTTQSENTTADAEYTVASVGYMNSKKLLSVAGSTMSYLKLESMDSRSTMYFKKKKSHAPASSVKGKHSYLESSSTVLTEHTNSRMAEVLENEGFYEFVEMLVNKTVEYVYLEEEFGNPYKFVLASEIPLGTDIPRYVTLSRFGITRHSNGECEKLSFEQFLHEQKIFNKLLTIPMFYNCKKWKIFSSWKYFVRRSIFDRRTDYVSKNLLYLDESLRSSFFKCGMTCATLQTIKIVEIEKHTIYELLKFQEYQDSLQEKAVLIKDSVISEMVDFICNEIERNIISALVSVQEQIPITISGAEHSISILNTPRSLSFTERSKIRQQCRKLLGLIRLADFMLRDAVFECVEVNLVSLRAMLSKILLDNDSMKPDTPLSMRTYGVFRVEAHLHEREGERSKVVLDPDPSFLLTKFRESLGRILLFGNYTDSIMLHPRVKDLLSPISNELTGQVPFDVMSKNKEKMRSIFDVSQEIFGIFSGCLDRCLNLMSEQKYLCENFDNNSKYFVEISSTKISQLTPEQISDTLKNFGFELEFLKTLPKSYDIGIFRFETGLLFRKFLLKITQCLDFTHKKIVDIFVSQSERIYNELFTFKSSLNNVTKKASEFVALIEKYNSAQNAKERLGKSHSYLILVKVIIEDYEIQAPDIVQERYITLQSMWFQYVDALEHFADFREENTKFYRRELETSWRSVQSLIQNIKDLLKTESIYDPTASPSMNINIFEDIQSRMDIVWKMYKDIEKLQLGMNILVVSSEILDDMKIEIDSNHTLWKVFLAIESLNSTYTSANFMSVPCSNLLEEVSDAANDLKYRVTRPNEKVRFWLEKSIANLSLTLPLVHILQSKTFVERHISKISTFLGKNIFENQVTTLELLSLDILEHKDQIHNVYEAALRESNIEFAISEVMEDAESLQFRFDQDEETKLLIVIPNIKQLIQAVESMYIKLTMIKASSFSLPHMESRDSIEEKLSTMLLFLESADTIQSCFFQYRHFFSNSRVARYMTKSIKDFHVIDDFWKALIKNFREFPRVCRIDISNDQIMVNMLSGIHIVCEAVERVRFSVNTYIEEQCRKFPRLYLLKNKLLQEILVMAEFTSSIESLRGILNIDGLIFDRMDSHLTIGCIFGSENIIFKSPSSSRSSFIDWLRGIFHALTEKLRFDIKDLLDEKRTIFDDIKLSKSLDQARICFIQIKFWEQFSRDPNAIEVHLEQTGFFLEKLVNCALEFRTSYQRISIFNALVVVTSHKEILEKLTFDIRNNVYDIHHSFAIDFALKKHWDKRSNTILCSIADMTIDYGMCYSGFSQRLVVTPFTDRCYVSLTNAFRNACVPFLHGSIGSGKKGIISELAYALGADFYARDCSSFDSIDDVYGPIQAAISCGLWVSFENVQNIVKWNDLFASFLGCLISVRNVLAGKIERFQLGGVTLFPSSKSVRLNVVFDGGLGSKIHSYLPPSIQSYFTLLHLASPQREAIFTILLQIYGLPDLQITSQRIAIICSYFLNLELLTEKMLTKLIVKAVKIVGEENLSNLLDPKKFSWILFCEIIRQFPENIRQRLDNDILKMLANIFLDIVVVDSDELFQQNQSTKSLLPPILQIKEALLYGMCSNLVLCGPPSSGKSTLVSRICDDINRQVILENLKILPPWLNSSCMAYDSILKIESCKRSVNLKVIIDGHDLKTLNDLVYFKDYMRNLLKSVNKKRTITIVSIENFDSDHFQLIFDVIEDCKNILFGSNFFIWECSDVDTLNFDPSTLQICSIIKFNDPLFSLQDFYNDTLSTLFVKFTQYERDCLLESVRGIIESCLTAVFFVDFTSSSINIQLIGQIRVVLRLVYSLYYYAGIESRFKKSDISAGVELNRDEANLSKIVLFSCVWVIGSSLKNLRRTAFRDWFRSHVDKTSRTIVQYFPDEDDPFGYYLVSDYRGHSHLMWRKWNSDFICSDGQPENINMPHEFCINLSHATISSTFWAIGSLDHCIIPTRITVGAQVIQSMLIRKGGQLAISGDRGVGKTTLLKLLTADAQIQKRWVSCLSGNDGPFVQNFIEKSNERNSIRSLELKLSNAGAIFIDDVSIPDELEVLRYLNKNGCRFSRKSNCFVDLIQLYSAFCLPSNYNERDYSKVLDTTINIAVLESDLISIFTSILYKDAPQIPIEFSLEIITASFGLYKSLVEQLSRDDVPCTMFKSYSLGPFLQYTTEYMKVISKNLHAVTRIDAFKAFAMVIKDYTADFGNSEALSESIMQAISCIDDVDHLALEVLKKSFRQTTDTENVFAKYVTSLSTAADVKVGFWPSNTPVKSVKGFFAIKEGLDRLPPLLNSDEPTFWRDVQKICSISLVKNSAAVITDHAGPRAIRSILEVASVLTGFKVVCLDVGGPLEVFLERLAKMLIDFYIAAKTISEGKSAAIWHIHFNESEVSVHSFYELINAVLAMTTNPLARVELTKEYLLKTGKPDIDYFDLMSLTKFMSFQIPLFSYPVEIVSSFVFDKRCIDSFKNHLHRTLVFSHQYTFSVPYLNNEFLVESIGSNSVIILEKVVEYCNDFVIKCGFPSCLTARVTSKEYKANTVQTLLHLKSKLFRGIEDYKNTVHLVLLTIFSRYTLFSCRKEFMAVWMDNVVKLVSELEDRDQLVSLASITDFALTFGKEYGADNLVDILEVTADSTSLYLVILTLITNFVVEADFLLVDQSGLLLNILEKRFRYAKGQRIFLGNCMFGFSMGYQGFKTRELCIDTSSSLIWASTSDSLTAELAITLLAGKDFHLESVRMYTEDSSIIDVCSCINALLAAISTVCNNCYVVDEFISTILLDLFIIEQKLSTSVDILKQFQAIFFKTIQHFSSRIKSSEFQSCQLLFIFLSSNRSLNILELSYNTLKYTCDYQNKIYVEEKNEWKKIIHGLHEALEILSLSEMHSSRHHHSHFNSHSSFEIIFRLQNHHEDLVKWIFDYSVDAPLLPPISIEQLIWPEILCCILILKPMNVLSALEEIVHCIVLQESQIVNADYDIRESLSKNIECFASSATDLSRRIDSVDILVDPLESSCSNLKQIYVSNCNNFTDVTNLLFSTLGSYETLFVDDTHLNHSAASEDKSLSYIEGGNLHILASHVDNDHDILEKVLTICKQLKPSGLFLETQHCISSTPLRHLGTNHILYFSENFYHGQTFIFLYAAKVLNSSLSNNRLISGTRSRSSYMSSRDHTSMLARFMWLLCMFCSKVLEHLSSGSAVKHIALHQVVFRAATYLNNILSNGSCVSSEYILGHLQLIICEFTGASVFHVKELNRALSNTFTSLNIDPNRSISIAKDIMLPDVFSIEAIHDLENTLKRTSRKVNITNTEYEKCIEVTAQATMTSEFTKVLLNKLKNCQALRVSHSDLYVRFSQHVEKIYSQIPEEIDLNSTEVCSQIRAQIEKIRQEESKIEWRRLRKATLQSHTGPQISSGRRRIVVQELLKAETRRMFAPLYAVAILEANIFNRFISKLRKYLASLRYWKYDERIYEQMLEAVAMFDSNLTPQVLYNSCECVCLTSWVDLLVRQQTMLSRWLTTGISGEVNIRDVSNPRGLLWALREQFATAESISVEETRLHVKIIHSNSQYTDIHDENPDCRITFIGVSFKRGYWDFETMSLRLHDTRTHKKQDEISISITVKSTSAVDEDDEFVYKCPLFVYCPTSVISFKNSCSGKLNFLFKEECLLKFPIRVDNESEIKILEDNFVGIYANT